MDFAGAHSVEHLNYGNTGRRQFVFRQAPHFTYVPAMFGIGNRTLTRKLIGFLSVLAPTLAVALAGDGAVAATRRADFSRCQHQIYVSQDIVDAVGVMFDAASMHHHRGLGAAIHARGLYDL